VLIAKTHGVQVALGAAFAARRVRKTYAAVLHGRLQGCAPLGR
jgi:23S rRNA-/tRNA-specific pseudouridylate synthase